MSGLGDLVEYCGYIDEYHQTHFVGMVGELYTIIYSYDFGLMCGAIGFFNDEGKFIARAK